MINWAVAIPIMLITFVIGSTLGYFFGWWGVPLGALAGWIIGEYTAPLIFKE